MGGRPPSVLRAVERSLRGECRPTAGSRLLVACSGGPDSQALLHALALVAPRVDVGVVACGVDHGLRPEAAAELDLAEGLARSLDVPFHRVSCDVARGSNLQARARSLRRAALEEAAARSECAWIATGHHRDDRVETFLLRLLRGTGRAGLSPLPPRAGRWLRPLLRVGRPDVLAHVRRHRLPYAEDPTNRDPRFLRARVRLELLPLLHQLSPGFSRHVEALLDELAGAADHGEALPLSRAQLLDLRRLLERGEGVVWLADGRELRLERPGPGATGRRPRRRGGAGTAPRD